MANQNMEDEFSHLILQEMALSETTYEHLTNCGIDIDCLKVIEQDEINELFSDQKMMGQKILFKNRLKKWRMKHKWEDSDQISIPEQVAQTVQPPPTSSIAPLLWRNESASSSSMPSSSRQSINSPNPQLQIQFIDQTVDQHPDTVISIQHHEEEKQKLERYLGSNVRGRLILERYGLNKCLDRKSQCELVHLIVEDFIYSNRHMTSTDMRNYAYAIQALFPNELAETYYKDRKGNKNPRGKIYDRYFNARFSIRKRGLDFGEKKERAVNQPPSVTITTPLKKIKLEDEDLLKCLSEWLLTHDSPWEKVCANWIETLEYRRLFLSSLHENTEIAEILKSWPRYADPLGYQLIDLDWNYLNLALADDCNLFIKWSTFENKIIDIFKKSVRQKNSCQLIALLENEVSWLNACSRNCITLRCLHAILKPIRITRWLKPSISEAQEDFTVLCSSEEDIEEKMASVRKYHLERDMFLQPRIIVVGSDFCNLTKFFVVCDGLRLELPSYLECVDTIIKMSFVFNTNYSDMSKVVWTFIQRYFYGIHNSYDCTTFEMTNLLNILEPE